MNGTLAELALDHCAVIVSDLDVAKSTFTRLGFMLSARGQHSGSTGPNLPVIAWGQANHCAPFERGYLEIIGITNPAIHAPAKDLLKRYEGVHLIAFGCDDAEAAAKEIAVRIPGTTSPIQLERPVLVGPEGAEKKLGAFRLVHPPAGTFPEGRIFAVEHITPEVVWQPHLMTHPNGVTGLRSVHVVVDDPLDTANRFALLTNAPVHKSGETYSIGGRDRGLIHVYSSRWLPDWLTQNMPPNPIVPWIGGLILDVADLDQTGAFLESQGIPAKPERSDMLVVGPEYAHGITVVFYGS